MMMNVSDKTKEFIKKHIHLIETEDYKQLFQVSQELTLELIQVLKQIDDNGRLKDYLINSSDKELFKNLFKSFLVLTGEDYTGYFGGDLTLVTETGFHLYSQAADLYLEFDPTTRRWRLYGTYEDGGDDDGSYEMSGQGFDDMINNISHLEYISWFGGEDWHPEYCYIGDDTKYKMLSRELVWSN